MLRRQNSFALAVSLAAVFGLSGCGKTTSDAGGAAAEAHADHEHSHSGKGPHGGHTIDLGMGDFHAELTHDVATHKVAVYILDGTAKRAVPVDASSVTINCIVNSQPLQFVLPAALQPGDASGTASHFELVSEALCDAWDAPQSMARLNVMIAGRPYVGDIQAHDHAAGHGHSHAGDDALVWREEIAEQGYRIALGHHGQTLLAGHEVEPAVQVTREGQPIAEARVFNALLAADGQAVLAEEVATVYEPPTDAEPAHYAQGALQIPADTQRVVIRYRIVLPEGRGERTFDVPVAVE